MPVLGCTRCSNLPPPSSLSYSRLLHPCHLTHPSTPVSPSSVIQATLNSRSAGFTFWRYYYSPFSIHFLTKYSYSVKIIHSLGHIHSIANLLTIIHSLSARHSLSCYSYFLARLFSLPRAGYILFAYTIHYLAEIKRPLSCGTSIAAVNFRFFSLFLVRWVFSLFTTNGSSY